MATAQLFYEDVEVGSEVRPMHMWVDQMQLVNWGAVSGNRDAGHWDIWYNRHKETDDPTVSQLKGQDPTVTGQFKMALMEKMLMDWGGAKAWVKKMDVKYRRWDYLFEMKTFAGTVVDKREQQGEFLIDLEIRMQNEEGQTTTMGTATVSLPNRS